MYTPLVRGLMVILALSLSIYHFIKGPTEAAYIMLLAVILIAWGYFKNGTVWLAFRKMKKQDFEGADKTLRQTRFPEYLKKVNKGYYHFIKAIVESHRENVEAAYKEFVKALHFGV